MKCCWQKRQSFGCKLIHNMPTVTNNFNKNKLVKTFSHIFLPFVRFWWWNNKKNKCGKYSINYFMCCGVLPSLIQFTNYTSFIKHFYVLWPLFGWKVVFVSVLSFGNLFIMKSFSHPRRFICENLKSFSINFYVLIWNTLRALRAVEERLGRDDVFDVSATALTCGHNSFRKLLSSFRKFVSPSVQS